MAASLKFKLNGTEFEAVPVKLERKKLYGFTDVVATDAVGGVCTAAQVDPDGELIIPPGSVKSGLLDKDGTWVERSETSYGFGKGGLGLYSLVYSPC